MNEITGTFTSFDGSKLFYRQWQHENSEWNGKILFLLHRGHEHSQRLESIAHKNEFKGYKIFSYDNRGHGYTQQKATHEFMNLVRDLDEFVKFICSLENKKEEDIFIVANSVAGVVASTWVHDFGPSIAGMALIAPAFKIKLYFPFANELLKGALCIKSDFNIKSYVKSKFLTHDASEQEKYDNDRLITPNIPAGQLTTLLDTAKRVVNDSQFISVPTIIFSAEKDYVVDNKAQNTFYVNLSSNLKKIVSLQGFYHGVLYEKKSQKVIAEISDFMKESFNATIIDQSEQLISYTQKEKENILFGNLGIIKDITFWAQKFLMNKFGKMSKGMKIGLKYGFDSGVTLDHIYKNEPSGTNFIGKMVDKNYLNQIGWRGIRQRKIHLLEILEEKIKLLQQEGKKVLILDIAGGPARYLIEIAEKYNDVEIQVRDYQEQNILKGQKIAAKKNLTNIEYTQMDAFDEMSYSQKGYSPNIIITSGVFELFDDNELITKAIKGASNIIEDGGVIIYTGQPWHPQLDQITHVLGNHKQEKWAMRRRSQYELDRLFSKQGFKKDNMKIDNWGIFTVSSAKK